MNRYRLSIPTLTLFFAVCLALSACGPKPTETTETPASSEPTGTVLALVGPNGGHVYNLAQLKALPVTEGQGGIKSSTGQITIPEPFKGVALKDLVAALGVPFDSSMGVVITAEDGYSMTFSYDQIMNGAFTAYDPAMGNELITHDPLTAIIAYEHNGQPLNTAEEGTLRLVVVSANNDQVVDGHWSVKWVNKIEVKPVGQTWTLDLQGAISSPVTRDSFQSCGSPSCHGTSWQDENGQTWVGVPLWLLVGEVDDSDSHTENAFNHTLADAGYTIDVVGGNGKTITLDSKAIKENNDILVAFMVNDGELPQQYFPLRLVGSGLQNSQMVGQITRITVNVPPAATPTTASAQENSGSLTISGMVNQEITLTDADLRALEIVTVNATGKNGPQDFQGVLLNPILDQAGIKDGATKLTFTASDNYSAEVNLSDVRNCPKALLAFMDTPGTYMIVLPDQPTSTWVKNIIAIEVK
ncbi:MAG: molybdopterin-dependent oxidoreductase [Anaerolineales bacterium]|jgi:DMSO/TMAO reductase YedYZ molybdopterin-dependent catalytic subunit